MELEEIRSFIGGHEPFTRLDAAQRGRAAKSVQIEYFRRGSVIIEVGVPNDWLSLVRSGAVELQLGGTALEARLSEGDVFGYPSLINNSPTRNRVTALEDCLLYRTPRRYFWPCAPKTPPLRSSSLPWKASACARQWKT